jgi:hypothetical protein
MRVFKTFAQVWGLLATVVSGVLAAIGGRRLIYCAGGAVAVSSIAAVCVGTIALRTINVVSIWQGRSPLLRMARTYYIVHVVETILRAWHA